ncbi:MAG: hypothetical protein RRZ64_08420 [Rikenellaceae bacterium]
MRYVLFTIILCLLSFLGGRHFGKQQTKILRDTVVHIDTFVYKKVVPQTVIYDRVVFDTLFSRDSVFVEVAVPINNYVFSDSLYRAEVSGYGVSLDKMEIFNSTKIITVTPPTASPKRWGIGLSAGYCATPKGLQPYLGVGLSYNIFVF